MKKKLISGQSIIELIIALILVSVVLTAVVGLVTRGISNNNFNRNKTLTTSYTSEVQEWLRSERDKNWAQFYTHATSATWCIPDLSWGGGASKTHSSACNTGSPNDFIPQTIYLRQVTFQRPDTSTVQATISVMWTDSVGLHNSQSTTIFSNWKGNQ